jgi:hypothetical protein
MQELIVQLREVPGRRQHVDYFAARLAYLTGDQGAAAVWLAKIGDPLSGSVLYPFPMDHWRMVYDFGQALRIARAELAIAGEEPAAAARHLKGLVETIALPELPADLDAPGELVRSVPTDATAWSTNGPPLKIIGNARFLVAEQVRKPERGMAAVKTSLTLEAADPLHLGLSVRARNRARGAIEVHEWDPATKSMHSLGRTSFKSGPRWDRIGIHFKVRDPSRQVWIFVYLDAAPGTRFGVKDIEIRRDVPIAIPKDWIPRTLAREYGRTLLGG